MKTKLKAAAKKFFAITSEALILTKRELWAIFSSLQTYIVLGLYLVILTILSFVFGRLSEYGTSDLSQFYTYVVGSFVIIIPALTMGLVSREKDKGTIEYLLTQPVKDITYVISKFLSASLLVVTLMVLTLPFVITILLFSSDADLGQIFMQFLSPSLVGLSFAAIGITFSSIFSSEITAFVASLVTSVVMFLIGSDLLSFLPEFIKSFLNKFSILNHYQSLSRGVFDFRDIVFFVALIAIFFLATLYYILRMKYPRGDKKLARYWKLNVALIIFFIAFAYVGDVFNIRIDLTSNQKYTLSQETRKIINTPDSELRIDFFESSNLPAELSSQTKTVRDLLNDLEQSSGKVVYNSLDPISNTNLEAKLEEYNINPIQLRVNRDNSSEVVLGYYSIGFSYGDKRDKIDLSVTGTEDLEFQIAKKIKNLVGKEKLKLAIVNNNVENYLTQNLQVFNSQLAELYEVIEVALNNDTDLTQYAGVFIPSPNANYDQEVTDKLKDYFNNGGGIFITTENVKLDENSNPQKTETNLLTFLSELGLEVKSDLVYDLKDNNLLALSSDLFPVVINYPLWPVAMQASSESEITKDINTISMLWANSIEADLQKMTELGLSYQELFKTSELSNIQSETEWNVSPNQEFSQNDDDKSHTLAASVQNQNGGRIIVAGDGQFITDEILQALSERNSQDTNSISFGLNSVSWITKDSLLGGIKSKVRTAQQLNLLEYQKVILVSSLNAIPMVLLILMYLYIKRSRANMKI